MESHLEAFIAVLVVHIVDDVECVYIKLSEPCHHIIILLHNLIIIEVFGSDRSELGSYLSTADLINTAVDSVKETLSEVSSCTEELHFLTNSHGGYAASDSIVIAVSNSHHIIILILNWGCVDGDLCTICLPCSRKSCGPENCHVRLGRCAECFKSMEVTEAGLCNHVSAVNAHTAEGLCYPLRVTWEEGVVLGSSCKTNETELHDEVVNNFLSLNLSNSAKLEISLKVDVKEGCGTSERHSSTILILNSTEITEVNSLNSFLSSYSRLWNVAAIDLSHLLEVFKSSDLLGDLFSCTNLFLSHRTCIESLLSLLIFDKSVNTVQSNTSVVTDDSTSSVSIGKTCKDMSTSCSTHFRSINIKYACVMCLSVFGEDMLDFGVNCVAVVGASLFSHSQTAVGHKSSLEGLISLKTNDLFEILFDISCTVRCKRRYNLCIHIENAAGFSFLLSKIHNVFPKLVGSVSSISEEAFITIIGCVVFLDKVTNIDFTCPVTAFETFPFLWHLLHNLFSSFNLSSENGRSLVVQKAEICSKND